MNIVGKKTPNAHLSSVGITKADTVYWNLNQSELVEAILKNGEGTLTDAGAVAIDTGTFTGRSPKDRFIVKDGITTDSVWWGDINIPFSPEHFDALLHKVTQYLENKSIYVRDAYACADPKYRLNIRVITEFAYSNLFAHHLFLRPSETEINQGLNTDWHIINAPGFKADPTVDGTRQANFAIINFSKKIVLIGGTGYTGEIKKSIFSILNYLLPHDNKVLSMHCSANIGAEGDTAIFFGLSGTGKTTLSADPQRGLIGDDEHGWGDSSIFNFEGGCYAKCVNLSQEKEPQIWDAIRFGTLVENTRYLPGTRTVDYDNTTVTENTRAAYPIHYINNAVLPSTGGIPKNIFFLTADAFGVLPPISKLTKGQAMFHFISGYTAKVAGTEVGVTEPQTTFSACFGKAFLPLHPGQYAQLLGEKMEQHNVNVWLINTGWTAGSYGVGHRMKLSHTRNMIAAALNGKLDAVTFEQHPIFGVSMPTACEGVPSEILNPKNTWSDKQLYDQTANNLAQKFVDNFNQFKNGVSEEVIAAMPKVLVQY